MKLSSDYNLELEALRKAIDEVDMEILQLLRKRTDIVQLVREVKRKHDIPIYQPERFQQLLAHLQHEAQKKDLSPELITKIWTAIHEQSLKHQQS